MKKYLIALAAFTITAASVSAQEKTTDVQKQHHEKMDHKKMGHGKYHHNTATMMKGINLTDAQKEQAKVIRTDYQNQLKQLKENGNSVTLNDYNAKKAALQKDQKTKFEALLTQDQKNKIAQEKKGGVAKRGMMEQKRMDKMKGKLNLTDAQVAQLKSQHESFKSQAKTVRENTALSMDQKKEKLMDLRKQSQENEKNILTPEQLQKKEEMKSDRMHDMKNKREEKS